MQIVELTPTSTAELALAMLVYRNQTGETSITLHGVNDQGDGAPLIGPGRSLDAAELGKLLALTGQKKRAEFIPANLLSQGTDSIAWWVPPSIRTLWFRCDEKVLGTVTAPAPNPGLLFTYSLNDWRVHALSGAERPQPDDAVFVAPYMNVWQGGRICSGNIPLPSVISTAVIEPLTDAFFSSNFTHPNVHAPNALVRHKRGPYHFWKDMLSGKHETFPNEVLVPAQRTVADIIGGL